MSLVMNEPRRRSGIGRRIVRAVRKAWHRWCISSNDAWVRACAADGILDSNSLRAVRDDTARHRVALALLEAQA